MRVTEKKSHHADTPARNMLIARSNRTSFAPLSRSGVSPGYTLGTSPGSAPATKSARMKHGHPISILKELDSS